MPHVGDGRCCSATRRPIYIDLMRFALIDSYGARSSCRRTSGRSRPAGRCSCGVGGFVYFWKAEETVRPWLTDPDHRTTGDRVPTVIADDVHIVYRVNGAGTGKGSATAALSRIIAAQAEPRRRAQGARRARASASPRTGARPSA